MVEKATPFSSDNTQIVVAECPAGTKAIGGGTKTQGTPGIALTLDMPDEQGKSWFGGGAEITPSAGNWQVVVRVICAKVAS